MSPLPTMNAAGPSSAATDLRTKYHPTCFVCGPGHGLSMSFALQPDDSVAGQYTFGRHLEGYTGVVHGGIVAAALDGAMANWLFIHGHRAVTAELKVRYLHPLVSLVPVTIHARKLEGSGPLSVMTAELLQHGRRVAKATGKFVVNASSAKITEARP